MRDYGKVHSTFWTSDTTRGLSDDGKTLAIYLLTGPHTNIIGGFRLPDGYAAEDLKWDIERVSKGFGELFQKGFATRDNDSKWVAVNKYLKWNPIENPNQATAAFRLFEQIPDSATIKSIVANGLLEYAAKYTAGFETLLEPFQNPSGTLSKPGTGTGEETGTGTEDPPISPQGDGGPDDGSRKKDVPEFERFWEAYPSHCPRKNAKGAAERKFQALRKTGRLPPIDEILSTLAKQARSPSWTKNGGEFIPAPLTWLNQERWRDGAIEQSFPPPGNSLPRVEDVVSPNLTPEEQKAVKIAWEEAKKRVFKKIE